MVPKKRCLDAFLNQCPLTLASRWIRHLHQPLFELIASLLFKLLPEGDREAYRPARNVQYVVMQFAPKTHRRAFKWCFWSKWRFWKYFIQIGADYTRLYNYVTVMHEHRHEPAWIQRFKFGCQMFTFDKA